MPIDMLRRRENHATALDEGTFVARYTVSLQSNGNGAGAPKNIRAYVLPSLDGRLPSHIECSDCDGRAILTC
ncbi:hypothetical protein HYQ45_010837 [Verticillium longisporum]|uniref:Uncharacterized protein n=1 Tax=Verticillium longisporum TaxID=100787 RepID=A0A8I3ALY5_VERLO|nr:hypothetical protein HYQ45_010837 [Verticillium longisporum]